MVCEYGVRADENDEDKGCEDEEYIELTGSKRG